MLKPNNNCVNIRPLFASGYYMSTKTNHHTAKNKIYTIALLLFGLAIVAAILFTLVWEVCRAPMRLDHLASDMRVCHQNTFRERGERCLKEHAEFFTSQTFQFPRTKMVNCLKKHPSDINYEGLDYSPLTAPPRAAR